MMHFALPLHNVILAGNGVLTLGLLVLIDTIALLGLGILPSGRQQLRALLDGDYWLRRARRRHSLARLFFGPDGVKR